MIWPDDYLIPGIKPYHVEDAGIIYCADCRDILPQLPKVDLVLTDPPYGLGYKYDIYVDSRESWFHLMDDVMALIISKAKFTVLPCCGLDRLQWWYLKYPPTWPIIWYKGSPGHCSYIGFNDWELLLSYGKPPKQIHDFFKTPCGFDKDYSKHPCPKPELWAQWLIKNGSIMNAIMLDPFMGSGTTIQSAKKLNRKFIGIEISEEYCAIAVKRLRQKVFNFEERIDE